MRDWTSASVSSLERDEVRSEILGGEVKKVHTSGALTSRVLLVLRVDPFLWTSCCFPTARLASWLHLYSAYAMARSVSLSIVGNSIHPHLRVSSFFLSAS